MKFAFLIFKYFPFGGVQRDMLRIALDLISLGHSVTIYTGEWRGDRPAGIQIELLPVRGLFNHQRHQSLIDGMQAAMSAHAFDLVLGFNRMPNLDVYFAADPCFVARAKKNRPWWYRFTPRYRFFAATENAVMRADGHCKILLIEPTEKQQFQAFYHTPDARFHLLSPNIPTRFLNLSHAEARQTIRQSFALPENATLLLSVCANFLLKGVDRSIAALASLPDDLRENTWLIVLGGGDQQAMRQLAKKYMIEKHVIFAGSREDVPTFMHAADLMLHPARAELAGLVIIEAMVSGLPQIVSSDCGYAFHVHEAHAGHVLASPFDQAAFNHILETMLTSSTRALMAESAIQYTKTLASVQSDKAEAQYLIGLVDTAKS